MRTESKSPRLAAAACCLGLASGCVQGSDYARPAVEVPGAYRSAGPQATAALTHDRWWVDYGDRHLDALVDEALANNRDLRIATARVDEFSAILAGTKSQG